MKAPFTILSMAGNVDGNGFVQLFVPSAGCAEVGLARETARLWKLWVYPPLRRLGVGAALFAAAHRAAFDAGKVALTWTVKKDNAPALLFYLKHGGRIVEDREDGYYLMSCSLREVSR